MFSGWFGSINEMDRLENLEDKLKKDKWFNFISYGVLSAGTLASLYFAKRALGIDYSLMTDSEGRIVQPGIFDIIKQFKDLFCFIGTSFGTFALHDLAKTWYIQKSGRYVKHKIKKKVPSTYTIKDLFKVIGIDLKIKYAGWVGMFDKERKYEILQEMRESGCKYFMLYNKLYECEKKQGKTEEAVFNWIETLRAVREQKGWVNPVSTRDNVALRIMNPFKKRDFFYYLENLSSIFICGEYVDAFHYLVKHRKKLMSNPGHSLLTSMVVNDFTDAVPYVDDSWREIADELWAITIDQIYSDDSTIERKIEGSRNVVKEFGPSKVLSSLLVTKESENKQNLEFERDRLAEIEGILLDYPYYHVPETIYLDEHDSSNVMILRRKNGEHLDKVRDISQFESAAEYLGLIHANLAPSEKERDSEIRYNERILSSPYDFLKPLVNEWGVLFKNIEGDMVFNKDAHGNNWIVNKDGITALDFEDIGSTRQEYDLVKLIERAPLFSSKGLKERVRTVKSYCSAYGAEDSRRLMKGYLSAALPSAIGHFVHSRASNFGDNSTRKVFLDNARTCLHLLGNPEALKLEKYAVKAAQVLESGE